jgi:hypothetical protein
MKQTIKIGKIMFPEIQVKPSEIHKVRGYFATQFEHLELLHNHQRGTDKLHYRYPAVQFKLGEHLSVLGFKPEGISILKEIFLSSDDIRVEHKKIPVRQREIIIKDIQYGEDGQFYLYEFTSPWVGLNQKNYRKYLSYGSEEDKKDMLHSILVNNIISFCKFAGYTIKEKLKIKSTFIEVNVNLKNQILTAFKGEFMVNFLLPDQLGLGKSSSRGFGAIQRKM